MATRPAWTLKDGRIIREDFEFAWNGGFAITQKQKNINGLHQAIRERTSQSVLEISTKSTEKLGQNLSAFHLMLSGKHLENIFQAAKKYKCGGPYLDLLDVEPKDAKRDERHRSSGKLVAFVRNGEVWPLEPRTAFYDYPYVSAVYETYGTMLDLSQFQWYTDIEFNPKKSINCQARSVTIYKLLQDENGFDILESMDKWLQFHKEFVFG